mmetsp:Transcript_9634/g.16181  ORF Transcript_9634/g.16181 Transcript_9634/m.16181 type:complete len:205 (-) Transcript_9634:607-1221(-)
MKNIRSEEENPGLLSYEVDLLRLVEKVTNGSEININKTGSRLIFRPGIIDCNEGLLVQHKCDLTRSVTYYLEVICIIAIFGKTPLNLELEGNTIDEVDQSVDSFKSSLTHLLNQFGASDTLKLTVKRQGYSPLGGGLVKVYQDYAKKLESVSMTDEGKVKRIRGNVTSAKVSPQLTTRLVDKLREIFNDYIPDVWIHTDHFKKG